MIENIFALPCMHVLPDVSLAYHLYDFPDGDRNVIPFLLLHHDSQGVATDVLAHVEILIILMHEIVRRAEA